MCIRDRFLTPQHFQTQDRFFEDALQFRFAASHYANWGVTELDIDSDALGNGLFRLNQCSGIMPDGEPFDIPEADELPPSRSVAEHFPPTRDSLDVFLAIPENRPRARNVTIPGAGQAGSSEGPPTTRYLAETRMVTDDNACLLYTSSGCESARSKRARVFSAIGTGKKCSVLLRCPLLNPLKESRLFGRDRSAAWI